MAESPRAISDDEESDSSSVLQGQSSLQHRLLFSKSKVYVHPTASAEDNVAGFIALIEDQSTKREERSNLTSTGHHIDQQSSLLLAWVPEYSLGDSARAAYIDVELSRSSSAAASHHKRSSKRKAAEVPRPPSFRSLDDTRNSPSAFAVPFSDLFSLLIRLPSRGWWYGSIIINTQDGGLPPLFFHDDECQSTILQKKQRLRDSFDPFSAEGNAFWGGDEVLAWLRLYLPVERSRADPSLYLIDPLSRRPRSEEDRAVTRMNDSQRDSPSASSAGVASATRQNVPQDAGIDPLTKALKQVQWNFLEKMSRVTNFTRRTATDLTEHPNVPPQIRRMIKNPEIQTLQEEFDSARIYLARWAMSVAEQGERERKQRLDAAQDIMAREETKVGDFELLEFDCGTFRSREVRRAVTLEEWNGFFDSKNGKLKITADEVKERIFHGGLDPSNGVRKEAWLFLLEVYSWTSSREERQKIMSEKREEYVRLKKRWWDALFGDTASNSELESLKDQKNRIEKDVHRTDRNIPLFAGEDIPHPDAESPFSEVGTNVHLEQLKDLLLTYNEYNRDLGYVQGMSDLLSPIYAVEQDDAVAFWAFVNFMKRMERNFLRDQSGMRLQLLTLDHLVQLLDPALYVHLQSADSTNFFFFFRMMLVWYKRELEWADALRLWESLWTDFLSRDFHLFIALAILEKHREALLQLRRFDEVLRYINDLSTAYDIESLMVNAEALFGRFQRIVEAIDKKDNFPRPRLQHHDTSKQHNPLVPVQSSTQTPGSATDTSSSIIDGKAVISTELRQLLSRKAPSS